MVAGTAEGWGKMHGSIRNCQGLLRVALEAGRGSSGATGRWKDEPGHLKDGAVPRGQRRAIGGVEEESEEGRPVGTRLQLLCRCRES